jgi:hypothetical protein
VRAGGADPGRDVAIRAGAERTDRRSGERGGLAHELPGAGHRAQPAAGREQADQPDRDPVPGNDVYISLREDEPPTVSPRTGEFATYTRADGEVVQVKTELGDGVIRQFFDSDDGQKEHVYRLREDGTLALEVTVLSEKLRAPFRYTWVYRQ